MATYSFDVGTGRPRLLTSVTSTEVCHGTPTIAMVNGKAILGIVGPFRNPMLITETSLTRYAPPLELPGVHYASSYTICKSGRVYQFLCEWRDEKSYLFAYEAPDEPEQLWMGKDDTIPWDCKYSSEYLVVAGTHGPSTNFTQVKVFDLRSPNVCETTSFDDFPIAKYSIDPEELWSGMERPCLAVSETLVAMVWIGMTSKGNIVRLATKKLGIPGWKKPVDIKFTIEGHMLWPCCEFDPQGGLWISWVESANNSAKLVLCRYDTRTGSTSAPMEFTDFKVRTRMGTRRMTVLNESIYCPIVAEYQEKLGVHLVVFSMDKR